MTRHLLPGLLASLALAACATARPHLAGQWAPQSAELGGRVFPVATFAGATLRLTGDTYDFAGDKGTYALVSRRPPAQMDIRGHEGPNAGRTILAIYRLAGDTLVVCYQLGQGERPSDFATATGTQILLVRYTRVP